MGATDRYYIGSKNTTLVGGDNNVIPTAGFPPGYEAESPILDSLPFFEVALGDTLEFTATVSQGINVTYFKDDGPDFMMVDPETGEVSWDTTYLPRGQAFALTIGASTSAGIDTVSTVIHVDNIGTSKIRILGEYQSDLDITLSTYIRVAAYEINSGDTLIIPNGNYQASITGSSGWGNRENAFASDIGSWIGGSNAQLTGIYGASPDGVVVSGEPHDDVGRVNCGIDTDTGQGNALENYAKIGNIEYTRFQNSAIACNAPTHVILENVGATDSGLAVEANNYAEADAPYASVAAAYLGGGYVVFDTCYAFGACRQGLQFGNPVSNCLGIRNIVRLDEYRGVEPRAGFLAYKVAELGVFNNFVVDADQEDAAPFYDYYSGAFAAPSTGDTSYPTGQQWDANVVINVQMICSIFDAETDDDVTRFDNFVAWDTVSSLTPGLGDQSPLVMASNDTIAYNRGSFGKIASYEDLVQSDANGVFRAGKQDQAVDLTGFILYKIGWNGSTVVNVGPILGATNYNAPSTLSNFTLYDFLGEINPNPDHVWEVTGQVSDDPTANGWDYITRVEDGSPLDILSQGAVIEEFKGPKGFFEGDVGWDVPTGEWCWPAPGEDTIRAKAKLYVKTDVPTRASTPRGTDFGIKDISGDRGFCVDGESLSEYSHSQLGRTVPPLRSFAKAGVGLVKVAVGRYKSFRWDTITKFKVYSTADKVNPIAVITPVGSLWAEISLAAGEHSIFITAVDPAKITAWGGNEQGESGRGELHTVTVT